MKLYYPVKDASIIANIEGTYDEIIEFLKLVNKPEVKKPHKSYKFPDQRMGRPRKYANAEEKRKGRLRYFKERYRKYPELWKKEDKVREMV